MILTAIAMSFFVVQTGFAQDLGVLKDSDKPSNLLPASEFLKAISNPSAVTSGSENTTTATRDHTATDRRWGGWGGWGGGWGGWGGYSGYGYGYPYYYYPYYSGYYWPSYYGGYWADASNSDSDSQATTNEGPRDAAHTPVVCFASNDSGNWFASADLASNAVKTQDAANHECVTAGVSCAQSLGCALAYH